MPQVSFNCFIKAQDTDWETFSFKMSDIYVGELNKWLIANSPDDATVFFNLDVLTSVRGFAFYTMSKDYARWGLGEYKVLKDFFDYKKTGSAFTLKIVAMASKLGAIIELSDLRPVRSVLLPTAGGTMQSYQVSYSAAKAYKWADKSGAQAALPA